jgi:hypothetical protein
MDQCIVVIYPSATSPTIPHLQILWDNCRNQYIIDAFNNLDDHDGTTGVPVSWNNSAELPLQTHMTRTDGEIMTQIFRTPILMPTRHISRGNPR